MALNAKQTDHYSTFCSTTCRPSPVASILLLDGNRDKLDRVWRRISILPTTSLNIIWLSWETTCTLYVLPNTQKNGQKYNSTTVNQRNQQKAVPIFIHTAASAVKIKSQRRFQLYHMYERRKRTQRMLVMWEAVLRPMHRIVEEVTWN